MAEGPGFGVSNLILGVSLHWRRASVLLSLAVAFILLVTVIATAGFYFGNSSGYREADANRAAAGRATDANSRLAQCKVLQDVAKLQRCVEEAIRSSREGQIAEMNLEAQQAMARWNGWLLIAALLQFPVSLFGLVALLVTIAQGRSALDHARSAAEIQLRPYVLFGRVTIKIYKDEMWQIRQPLFNASGIPARNVLSRLHVELMALPLPNELPSFDEKYIPFEHISLHQPANMNKLVEISSENIEKIKNKELAILVRGSLKYKPTQESQWEELSHDRIFVISDLQNGEARIIPQWAYEVRAAEAVELGGE